MSELQGRILCVIHAPRWGGIHTIVERVGPICGDRGWPWLVVLPKGPDNGRDRLDAAGIRVVEIPLRRIRKTLNPLVQLIFLATIPIDIFRLMRLIHRERIDIVQVCGLIHFHSAIAGRLMGKAVVWQMHSDQPPPVLRRFFTPMVLKLADAAMTAGRKIITLHPGLAGMGDRVFAFFAPVDMQRYRPDADKRLEARELMAATPDQVIVSTAGGRGPNKNHRLLVDAAALLKDSHPNIRFVICGHWLPQHREYYETEVIGHAETLGLLQSGHVQFQQPGSRVDMILAGSDIFALPSHGEGISVVTAEAMATALPVVVNDVGSMSDFVEDGLVGRLNRSCSAEELVRHIAEIADDPALRQRFGDAALDYALANLDQQVCADVHIAAYLRAMEYRDAGV